MIYDCFIFNNELDLLEIRINELKHMEVTHVLVQANKTFTGNPRAFIDIPHARVMDIRVTDMPEGNDPWERERHQRNAIMRGLGAAKDDDIVIIADSDELPSARAITEFNDKHYKYAGIVMDMYHYFLNCKTDNKWGHAKIMKYSFLRGNWVPEEVRHMGYEYSVTGGWHMTYMGGVEAVKNKIRSFSHQEVNTQTLLDNLERKISIGESLWSNDLLKFVHLDSSFPKYLLDNRERFKDLLKLPVMKIVFGGHWQQPPDGWTDLPQAKQDITKPLEHADESVDIIFTEHVIEHVNLPSAIHFMKESFRVLKKGGVFRCVCPMLEKMMAFENDAQGYSYGNNVLKPTYLPEEIALNEIGLSVTTDPHPFMMDSLLKRHDHQFVWTRKLMVQVLEKIGFEVSANSTPGKSVLVKAHDVLERRIRGVHGDNLTRDTGIEFYDIESLLVEAIKK
jgi:beta-1,4-mannosyl-glycoprotein beta-1,4-N-acetylglucosaminyltransferase